MNKYLQSFVNSFKLGKDFTYTFAADAITFSLLYLILTIGSSWWLTKLQALLAIVQEASVLGAGQLPAVVPSPTGTLFLVFIPPIVLVIFFLFLFSYSRAVIWNHLQGRKVTRKTYWRWNVLNLSLLIPLFLFGLVLVIAKIILSFSLNQIIKLFPLFYITHTVAVDNVRLVLQYLLNFYLLLVFISLVFLIYHSFAKSYKIWNSIGMGFSLFNKNKKRLLLALLLALIPAIILPLITIPLSTQLLYAPPWVSVMLYIILFSIYLAWLRLYLLKIISHGSQ
ncbi:hypothetical protein HYV87_05305 [Candidatus Woesearchaeota archaeon]|nr:hypothetical protein [Candidatus Woesearchaeota archaeon]MBI2582515.1 hypothetical protein [Candidatus Woesearchaeota archaeon]